MLVLVKMIPQQQLSNHDISSNENIKDMTSDLLSLNFENALSAEELEFVCLRSRHHCFTVTSCAYAAYLVSTFNEMRLVSFFLQFVLKYLLI